MIGSGSVWVRLRPYVTAGAALAAVLGSPAAAGAAAHVRPAAESRPAPDARRLTGEEVARAKSALARALAVSLADRRWAKRMGAALVAGRLDPLALADLPAATAPALRAAATRANRAILAAKGLPASTGSVLELRLADDSMAADAARHGPRLVAAETDDDRAATVTAFDRSGRRHGLDRQRHDHVRPVLRDRQLTRRYIPESSGYFRAPAGR